MPNELAPLVRALSLQRTEDPQGDGPSLHTGTLGDVEIVATRTGIGTARATRAAERLLDATDVEHVLVVGIAGGVGASRVGDVVRPEVVVDGATGCEHQPSPLDAHPASGKLVTSDEFHRTPEQLARMVDDGVVAVDMETAAVAAVCDARGRPWSVVRAISDLVSDYADDAVLGLAHPDGSPNVPAALRFVLTHPWRVPQLVRLARDAKRACDAAATTAAAQIAGGAA